jgi:hypothetical protein
VKRIIGAVLLTAVLATPAFAVKVYLKDGGVIQAKRVWREGGKVHVLATRHTLTSFEPSEINMKRTFPKRHKAARKVEAAPAPAPAPGKGTPAPAVAVPAKPADKKPAVALPSLPKLPEKSPESVAPGGGGTIRQHKKSMAEKAGD